MSIVVQLLVFDRWHVTDSGVEPIGVVPVDPHERGKFDLIDGLERTIAPNALGFVQADDGFCHGVDGSEWPYIDCRRRSGARPP